MNTKNWFLTLVVMVLVSLTISIATTRYIINNHFMPAVISEIDFVEKSMPRLATINTEQIAKDLYTSGEDQMQALHALALMVEMMREDGYVVMDEQVVLTSSERYQINEISVDAIYAEAERRGINVSERLDQRLMEAEEAARLKVRELESLLQLRGLQ